MIGAASSAVVGLYNDAAYGAETHQYGSQGLTEKLMLIPEVDFSGIARALGARSAIIRSPADLAELQDWIDAGAKGTFVADCRITASIRAPWLSGWMRASQAAKAAVEGQLRQTAAVGIAPTAAGQAGWWVRKAGGSDRPRQGHDLSLSCRARGNVCRDVC